MKTIASLSVAALLLASTCLAQTVGTVTPQEAVNAWTDALDACIAADQGGPLPACKNALGRAAGRVEVFVALYQIGGIPIPTQLCPMPAIHHAVEDSVTRRRVRTLLGEASSTWVAGIDAGC